VEGSADMIDVKASKVEVETSGVVESTGLTARVVDGVVKAVVDDITAGVVTAAAEVVTACALVQLIAKGPLGVLFTTRHGEFVDQKVCSSPKSYKISLVLAKPRRAAQYVVIPILLWSAWSAGRCQPASRGRNTT